MKLKLTGLTAALVLGLGLPAVSGFAGAGDKAQCSCSQECAENCKKGNGKDCKCKACDCAKTGKCPHGKCHHGEGKAEEKH